MDPILQSANHPIIHIDSITYSFFAGKKKEIIDKNYDWLLAHLDSQDSEFLQSLCVIKFCSFNKLDLRIDTKLPFL